MGEQRHPFERPGHHATVNNQPWARVAKCKDAGLKGGADEAKVMCALHADRGDITWFDILIEEVAEAVEASTPRKLREELVQVAAVALQMVRHIDIITAEEH